MEFFRDNGVCRVGKQPRRGQVVQQYRIDRIHRAGRDGVAKADIDLRLATRVGQFAVDGHTDAAVAGVFADLRYCHGNRIEQDAVVRGNGGDLAKDLGHGLQVAGAEAQQIGIARRPVRHVIPKREQQRALEHETVCVWRLRQTVKDAFQREAHQHLGEIHTLRLGDVEQASANGGGEIAHSTASRYGRITFATRQIFAYCQSSSTDALRLVRTSFSASSATSTPILLRCLKQSTTVLAAP